VGGGRIVARRFESMAYEFLVDTYRTERLKVLSVWSMFRDEDLAFPKMPAGGKRKWRFSTPGGVERGSWYAGSPTAPTTGVSKPLCCEC
jgi:hypothetical protein